MSVLIFAMPPAIMFKQVAWRKIKELDDIDSDLFHTSLFPTKTGRPVWSGFEVVIIAHVRNSVPTWQFRPPEILDL